MGADSAVRNLPMVSGVAKDETYLENQTVELTRAPYSFFDKLLP
ncbi:hypothetical protein BROSI_A0737 [Candidatus Brocadia sinica JPN1]|uniref:Uncharacterized protein n=1 Tax=Candidatus Brocadia sinica JPN1 TaxID=1197129 RepID=A0ABQ0JU16_9BACT|nr:hypothetical protein BROSI_A0737 [Candidatus Brocadia sinica JPN1]